MSESTLEERVRYFTEDYVRITWLQKEAYDYEAQQTSANDLADPGIAFFLRTL